MSIVLSVILVILIMVIFAFLQLPNGLFSIFYHFRIAKTNLKKADDAALSFILGLEIFMTAMWLLIYLIIFTCFYFNPEIISPIFLYIMAGISFAEAIAIIFFYFRHGKSTTALFIPRKVAKNLVKRAEKVKTRSDAIILGFFSGLPELLFTLPLFITCSALLQTENVLSRSLIIILAIIASAVPLFVIRFLFRTDHNLAEIERLRVKLKPHFRFILAVAYLAIAILLINLATMRL
ncbi:hypothetical protein IKF12_02790 [Candidatus Saccharibacteria bacterium]|nr:hypothetical protein [Candidatus Saccharibacteria bacterium]